jgi:SAM-dependent methyltransferase
MVSRPPKVERFFDRLADDYPSRYCGMDVFHRYFFGQRLEKSTEGFSFEGKTILDIGAGTGPLYDYLLPRVPSFRYFANDVSAEMLQRSRIPQADRFVGACYEQRFPVARFDYIFMLGVTTYLPREELDRILAFVSRSLTNRAIVTFTNRSGVDTRIRRALKRPIRLLGTSQHVLSQPFRIHAYSVEEVTSLLPRDLALERIEYLNHTFFPLNRLLPETSVWGARWIETHVQRESVMRLLSSDLLCVIRRESDGAAAAG